MLNFRILKAATIAVVAMVSLAAAQTPVPRGADTLHFMTKVGSFKMLGGSPSDPPSGRLEVSFTGTMLMVGLDGQLQVTGNLRKEYEGTKPTCVAYHGTGKIVIQGKMTSCQWFGRDMEATFKGRAVVRLYGEFDQNLDTGKFWFDNDPGVKTDWRTSGLGVVVPMPAKEQRPVPRVRTSGG